jgi:regulator of sirC expression with transglutaminase-like and TPR domain
LSPLQPVHCRPACFEAFRAALEDLARPGALLRAAAAIALHEHPDADLDLVEQRVAGLAQQVLAQAEGRSAKARLALVHRVLFEEHDFQGDEQTYSNPSNSYFPMILATRRGLPITLSLLYVEVARRVGLEAHGFDAPAHFLVEVEQDGGTMLVDPFHKGSTVTRLELAARLAHALGPSAAGLANSIPRATPRGWLKRILRNLEVSFERAGRADDQAAMAELAALLSA